MTKTQKQKEWSGYYLMIGFLLGLLIASFLVAYPIIKDLKQENERLNRNIEINNDLARLINIITSQENLHNFCLSKGYDDTAWVQTEFGSDKLEVICYDKFSIEILGNPSPTYTLEELFEWWRTT